MLKINLICTGGLKEKYWRDACAEYEKRLQPFCKFQIIELPEVYISENPSQAEIDRALQLEGIKVLKTAAQSCLIAMCIEGKELDSVQLAEKINDLSIKGAGSFSFALGSSYGLSDEVKSKAMLRLSMSKLTFPHQLARVMLCEQLYRTFQINYHGKYHK